MSKTDCAPNIPDILGCIGRICRIKKVLVGFPTRRSRSAFTKAQRLYLRVYTEASTDMSKRKPYTPPGVIRYESEAEYPARTRRIVKALRQELVAPQFE